MKNSVFVSLFMAAITVVMTGCASVQRSTPIASAQIDVNLARGDVTILGSVKGTSSLQSYVFGLVRVYDNDKCAIFGCKMFEDQYAFQGDPGNPWLALLTLGMFGGVNTEDRAYYKALAATPDADAVVRKAYVKQETGIPFIASSEEVTFIGKAIKFKAE